VTFTVNLSKSAPLCFNSPAIIVRPFGLFLELLQPLASVAPEAMLSKRRQLHAVIERIMEQGLSERLLQKQFSNEELVIVFVAWSAVTFSIFYPIHDGR